MSFFIAFFPFDFEQQNYNNLLEWQLILVFFFLLFL